MTKTDHLKSKMQRIQRTHGLHGFWSISQLALLPYLFIVFLGCSGIFGESVAAYAQDKPTAQKFIPVFTWYYYSIASGAPQTLLVRYSYSDLSRAAYKDNIGRNTWGS